MKTAHAEWMLRALALARRGYGTTSPNPMVGAILVRRGRVLGQGWHHRAGGPHAEVVAMRDARERGHSLRGATLYVTLEPCSTTGRTPPCTGAIVGSGLSRVVVGATDPNPAHAGRGLRILEEAGLEVESGVMQEECRRLNEAFNHWIVHRKPWVILKAGMTLDGKIATETGQSKWITSEASRREAMKWRHGVDALVVGVNTVLEDDPALSLRAAGPKNPCPVGKPCWYRIILDTEARTPLDSEVVRDARGGRTVVVVGRKAAAGRVRLLEKKVMVWKSPLKGGRIDLDWLMGRLGELPVMQVLVEGGGEIQGAFRDGGWVNRAVIFVAPGVLGGKGSVKAVGGEGAVSRDGFLQLDEVEGKRCGVDWMVTGVVAGGGRARVGRRK